MEFTELEACGVQRRRYRQRVYRRRNQRFQRNNVREVDRFGGGSIMVWGAIKFGWRSQLVVIEDNLTSQRYIDEVVTP